MKPEEPSKPRYTWGGARPGAGRKPKGEKAGVSHMRRPSVPGWFPVLVTLRMARGVWNLQTQRCFRALADALSAGSSRRGFHLVRYRAERDHVYLLVEADSRRGLSLGMQGLSIRIARGLNRLMKRGGRVLGDRYEAAVLRTPDEVRRARALVGGGAFAAAAPVVAPKTDLLAAAD